MPQNKTQSRTQELEEEKTVYIHIPLPYWVLIISY